MSNYRVLFEDGVANYRMGDVVEGHYLGDNKGLEYLVRIGAIEETEDAVFVMETGAEALNAQIQEMTNQLESLKEENLLLKDANEILKKELAAAKAPQQK